GKTFIFEDGKEVEAYLGIPYGKPPVGELRFKKPEPADPWNDVMDCTQWGPRCPHEDMWIERLSMFVPKSEDCLRLNVFTPTWKHGLDQKSGFAVMVWIHGGGFAVHSAAHYGDYGICKSLCTKDVVVVSINYRLGFFGFLSTGDEHARGNFGLWDQTLALRWVKENISAFGGDPNNVTIFGQSAGGASVDFLTLSPHSRDLFQKAIPMAGSACCTFATNTRDHVRNACWDFALRAGFQPLANASKSEQNKALVEFFRSLPAHQIEMGMMGRKGFRTNRSGMLDLTPVIDGDFLPKPVEELRKEVPKKIVMTGVTKHEGLLFVALRPPRGSYGFELDKLVTRELSRRKVQNLDDAKKKLLEMYYTGVDPINGRQMAKMGIHVVSDVYINNGIWDYADQMAQLNHTVYLYNFEYMNPRGFGLLGYVMPFKGATHASELPYIFNKGILSNFYPNEDDLKTLDQMTAYFTNFAKYGNPNGKTLPEKGVWKPLPKDDTLQFLRINLDKTEMCNNFQDGRMIMWRDFFKNSRRTLSDSSSGSQSSGKL
uniref:Carboxylic ester hydrolase n=1 Tax=Acrobeloides nanus TaxID=290746 RepID=A0A914CQI3_9BILA